MKTIITLTLVVFLFSGCLGDAAFFAWNIGHIVGEHKGADAKGLLDIDLDTARQTFLQIAKIEGMEIGRDKDIREMLRVPKEKESESAGDWRTEKGIEEPKKVIWGEVIGKELWAYKKNPERMIRIKMMKTEDNKVGIGVWVDRHGIGAATGSILISRWATQDKEYASHVLGLIVSSKL